MRHGARRLHHPRGRNHRRTVQQAQRPGSLLLGLYDDQRRLQHVGVCSSFTAATRRELVRVLAPVRVRTLIRHPWREWAEAEAGAGAAAGSGRRVGAAAGSGDGARGRGRRRAVAGSVHRRPGALSRWSRGKDLSWEPVRPALVVEVAYDHMQGSRFRHPAHFRRWRPDKRPRDCTFDQLEVVPAAELEDVFGEGR